MIETSDQKTPLNSLESALAWLALGYRPIPIERTAAKKCREKGWQDSRYTAEELPDHILPSHNVGVLLGDERGSADVDCDCFEAIAAARLLLPTTGIIFGRDSKPASHYFYRLSPGTTTSQFKDCFTKSMIVELRSNAKNGKTMQTVVPYSLHVKSGEWLRFEHGTDGVPAILTGEDLERHVAMLAAAAILARYYPPYERNTTELAIAGVLARQNWEVDDAVAFVQAVYAGAPANDTSTSGGGTPSPTADNSVRQTFENFERGQEVTGVPKLRECFGAHSKAVDTAMKWLKIAAAEEPKVRGSQSLVPSGDYKEHINMTEGKFSHPTAELGNVTMVLRFATEWAGALGFDEFTSNIVLQRDVPAHPRLKKGPLQEEHFGYIQEWFQLAAQHRGVGLQTIMQACYMVAKENPFHPVLDYLNDLDPWSEETNDPLLDTWLIKYLGAEDTPVNRAIGRMWLISMVARVKNPGCQADHMPIFEGEQGIRKSTAMRNLVPCEDWFTDQMPDISSKDADIQLQGKWLIEWSELDTFGRAEITRTKAFITRMVSRFRPPYGKVAADFKRQCIFVGTSNTSDYLKDETGARRFWPAKLGFGVIDIEALKRDRDLLWAEALARFEAKEQWWPDAKETVLLKKEQDQRYAPDDWTVPLLAWAKNPTADPSELSAIIKLRSKAGCVNTREALICAIHIPLKDISVPLRTRAARILTKAGWKDSRIMVDGVQDVYYTAPKEGVKQ